MLSRFWKDFDYFSWKRFKLNSNSFLCFDFVEILNLIKILTKIRFWTELIQIRGQILILIINLIKIYLQRRYWIRFKLYPKSLHRIDFQIDSNLFKIKSKSFQQNDFFLHPVMLQVNLYSKMKEKCKNMGDWVVSLSENLNKITI